MTEKSYGGNSGIPQPKPTAKAADTNKYNPTLPKNSQNKSEMTNLKPEEITKLKQAGEIAKQVKDYAKTIIKKGAPLLEIAEKIEGKIKELGGGNLPSPQISQSMKSRRIQRRSTMTHRPLKGC